MTPGLRLVQGPETGAATARQLRWWVRASLFGGDLRGVQRRPVVEPSRRPASVICKAACVGSAEASSVHSKMLVSQTSSRSADFVLNLHRFLEPPAVMLMGLGWAGTWKLLRSFRSSLDSSDLSSRPLTLRTLRHCPRKDNTREVNNRCIFRELQHRPNRLSSGGLQEAQHSLPACSR